jgi:spermidine synthase
MSGTRRIDTTSVALLGAVFFIATAGLIYELVAGTAATYLLGDSVTQFSLVIGLYLFAMGIGSYLSRYIENDLIGWFVRLELIVGLLGGFVATLLFLTFARDGHFRLVLYMLVGAIGIGVGLEIPLLIRILEGRMKLRDLLARVLFFDYLGALAASLAFPLLLVPKLGLIKTSLLLGALNALVGLGMAIMFRDRIKHYRRLVVEACIVLLVLCTGLWYSESLTQMAEDDLYPDEIVHASTSKYQRIVVTQGTTGEVRLYLNGHLQFSSVDEYRYHETLVHPAMALAPRHTSRALVLGGGDGLAVRELLRYPSIKSVHLIDLDPAITDLFKTHSILSKLNDKALQSDRVKITNTDAFWWLDSHPKERFDIIIIDFPDPSTYGLGKLYSNIFYALLRNHLTANGVAVVQATSPMVARRSYWCIDRTMRSVGLHTQPMHTFVPSFGSWGFILASRHPIPKPTELRRPTPAGLRYLTDAVLPGLFVFPADMARIEDSPINRLNNPHLVRLYDKDWRDMP